jgi:hypothetical protein
MAETRAPKPAAVDPEAWRRVTRQQLAALLGVHPDTVSDYSRAGMPVIVRGAPGKEAIFDAVESLTWWRARQGHNAKEAAHTRALDSTARLNELKLETQTGKLVPLEEVILAGQHYTRAWTAKVRALPRQLVQAGFVARECEASVAAVCRQLLEEISNWRTVRDTIAAGKPGRPAAKSVPVNGGAHATPAS